MQAIFSHNTTETALVLKLKTPIPLPRLQHRQAGLDQFLDPLFLLALYIQTNINKQTKSNLPEMLEISNCAQKAQENAAYYLFKN